MFTVAKEITVYGSMADSKLYGGEAFKIKTIRKSNQIDYT